MGRGLRTIRGRRRAQRLGQRAAFVQQPAHLTDLQRLRARTRGRLRDVGARRRLLLQALHQRADVDDSGLQGVFTRKREQPVGEGLAAVRCRKSPRDRLVQGPVIVDAFSDQLQVAADHSQQIVEIMRHAAGELADDLHLLGLAQLLLALLHLGDVGIDRDGAAARQFLLVDAPITAGDLQLDGFISLTKMFQPPCDPALHLIFRQLRSAYRYAFAQEFLECHSR